MKDHANDCEGKNKDGAEGAQNFYARGASHRLSCPLKLKAPRQ
jgi:hypothetical protein